MITLAEIQGQSLSSIICDFMICKRCGIVDRERSRIVVDSPCPVCHQSAGKAQDYFGLNIAVLIDLMQESYHSAEHSGSAIGPQSSNVAVVLYFCTLREALLNHLLDYLFHANKSLAEEMGKSANQKFAQLEKLMGRDWNSALLEASGRDGTDYSAVSKLVNEVRHVRNRFLHEASGWGATRQLAGDCINSAFTLLQLFASLHNAFVRPSFSSAGSADGNGNES